MREETVQIEDDSAPPDRDTLTETSSTERVAEKAFTYSQEFEQIKDQYEQEKESTEAEQTVFAGRITDLTKENDTLYVQVTITEKPSPTTHTFALDWPSTPDDFEDINPVDILAQHTGDTDTLRDTLRREVTVTKDADGAHYLYAHDQSLRQTLKHALVTRVDTLPGITYDPQTSSLTLSDPDTTKQILSTIALPLGYSVTAPAIQTVSIDGLLLSVALLTIILIGDPEADNIGLIDLVLASYVFLAIALGSIDAVAPFTGYAATIVNAFSLVGGSLLTLVGLVGTLILAARGLDELIARFS